MTGNGRPERSRYDDHLANAAETAPFITATCPFLRQQTKIIRFFEVSTFAGPSLIQNARALIAAFNDSPLL